MKWFMEAEGSRNYEDEAAMNELMRTLDTNGDGKVAQRVAHPPSLPQLSAWWRRLTVVCR